MSEWEQERRAARFYNLGGQAVVVVAVINLRNDKLFDWSAYIGIGPSQVEEDCIAVVAKTGNKLSNRDAQYYFPELPMGKWRP